MKKAPLLVTSLYRPPEKPIGVFLDDFQAFLEEMLDFKGDILISGDFNIHLHDQNNSSAHRFNDILDSFALKQHVQVPTHRSGHTLDLIITRYDELSPLASPSMDTQVSDHFAISCHFSVEKPEYETRKITTRKLDIINTDRFRDDLRQIPCLSNPPADIDTLVNEFNTGLGAVLDKHAPKRVRKKKIRPLNPWFDDVILAAKKNRRRCERIWLKTRLDKDKETFKVSSYLYNKILEDKKTAFYSSKILNCGTNQKSLFAIVNDIRRKGNQQVLPEYESEETLANEFATFFKEKIEKIVEKFPPNEPLPMDAAMTDKAADTEFTNFEPISVKEIKRYIMKAPNKYCPQVDPLPTELIESSIDILAPTLATIVNKSITSGIVPQAYKEAVVSPIIKKSNLEPTLANFRPVSNLPFISKIIEKVVSDQINAFTDLHSLDEPLQSAFKKGHSTETALVKVQNDILLCVDEQKVVLMALLDLSAAFDTCNHDILLSRLERQFHISGAALSWFRSYLTNRTQRVKIKCSLSHPVELETGFPQGSGWGPQAYSKYVGPLGDLLRLLQVLYHLFADDTQLLKPMNPNSIDSQNTAFSCLESTISEVSQWMTKNKLKLNESKTEFIIFGTKKQVSKVLQRSITVGGDRIEAKQVVRNLGSMFDSELKMAQHVSHVLRVGYFQLRQLKLIRKYLTPVAAKILVHASVISRLDYANALLFGIAETQLNRLQRLQNYAARLITRDSCDVDSASVLKKLHWLPIRARIRYKILLLTYKALNNLAPQYLKDILSIHIHARKTRSSNGGLRLVEPKSNLKFGGDRAFSVCAPKLWNKLPNSLRSCSDINSFKRRLKTHLFNEFLM